MSAPFVFIRLSLVVLFAAGLVGLGWIEPVLQGGYGDSATVASTESGTSRVPELIWPLGRAAGDGVFVQLGPDTDPASGAWADWECSAQFTYDGHRGTDMMAYNFRIMDQGVPVVAAAAGRVTWAVTDNFDRNYWTPYVGDPNGINIRHPDGSNSQYFHLRTQSVAVAVGDEVEAGQVIAYVGSSGSSPNPHLHFELWENGLTRDPNNGACNARASLWRDELRHPGETDLAILDWDIFLDTDLAGVEGNNYLGDHRLKNRPFRPYQVARSVEKLGVWVQLQGLVGAQYTVRVLDNAGAEFDAKTKGVSLPRSVQWHALYFDFGDRVSAMEAPEGTWTIELEQPGQQVRRTQFTVDSQTQHPLRFFPLAGRSYRLEGTPLRDTLRVRHASGAVAYQLHDAPPGVSLDDGQVVVNPDAAFSLRNGHFRVSATDASGRSDTMYYHIVSPDKPLGGAATGAAAPGDAPQSLDLEVYPNPASATATLALTIDRGGHSTLTVFDLLGRRVWRDELGYLGPGRHDILFPGTGLPAGTYLIEARSGAAGKVRTLTVVPTG